MTCVWGATISARIQFLILEAIRRGTLPWDAPWKIGIFELDTDISHEALEDLCDWFGRLRELFGFLRTPEIELVEKDQFDDALLVIDISVTGPFRKPIQTDAPLAYSRPANVVGPITSRKFNDLMSCDTDPPEHLIESFVRDFLRKDSLREGQYEIVSRILTGKDIVGLLPTGGGKSLTYQLCGLLRGGLTIYVSPLKSLMQDQRERLNALGIDSAQEVSSALSTSERALAGILLTSGGIRFLLVAPERFLIDGFRAQLAKYRVLHGEVSQVVIDECHCVSEWGHDFRPAYLSLSRIVKERTKRLQISAPLVALTGTASSIVLSDVKRELGIMEDDAVIRAKRLDRPEITMTCKKLRQTEKETALVEKVGDFLINNTNLSEGLLVFSRFVGGKDGVIGISGALLNIADHENMRFYSGSKPDWKQYAAFITRRSAKSISNNEADALIPLWALNPQTKYSMEWDEVKEKTQRDYISGLKNSYRVLVATNAFGMGIDKPSIRKVIHYITPQSPEAYYQEIGRAGRDKHPSEALLLFSDEDAGITDKLLDPGASIDDAKLVYENYQKNNRFKGGDFIRTFYFHDNSFSGPQRETDSIVKLIRNIRKRLREGNSLNFEYIPSESTTSRTVNDDVIWKLERNQEYAIVRLIILGVIHDYTKDYNAKRFDITLSPDWERIHNDPDFLADYYAERFRNYARRYQAHLKAKGEEAILAAGTILNIEENASKAIVDFVYEQIERNRRQASRQMLELARIGATDPDIFHERLMLYLQVSDKFTRDLESLALQNDPFSWQVIINAVTSPDELKELHGACQRVLESYPTHPSLLSISAVTRLNPIGDDAKRSCEELAAALRYTKEASNVEESLSLGNDVLSYIRETDEVLNNALENTFAFWMMRNGDKNEAIKRFFIKKTVRDHWIANVLRETRESMPAVMEF